MSAWERRGLVFRSQGQRPWMRAHAQMPHAEAIEGSLLRVYFTCRDSANRSHIGWLVFDLQRPGEVMELAADPLLAPGEAGRFDDCGVMSSWMTLDRGLRRFWIIGWNVRNTVPMHISIGSVSGPATGAPIIDERPAGPVLDRSVANPFYVSCPCVLPDEGGEGWRMWYLSGLPWAQPSEPGGVLRSRYTVWHARSPDGVTWRPDAQACLELAPDELAIARPCVVRDEGVWRMWHCRRGETFGYRIGHAQSDDGETWGRRDERLGLDPSGDGFDAATTCYPFVFDHGGERWMLYCGDGFGAAGFGLARLKRGGER